MGFQDLLAYRSSGGFGRQNRGRGGAILTPTNSFFLLGVLTSVPIGVKIDQEMRSWECSQRDTHTHWQTQTDFYRAACNADAVLWWEFCPYVCPSHA